MSAPICAATLSCATTMPLCATTACAGPIGCWPRAPTLAAKSARHAAKMKRGKGCVRSIDIEWIGAPGLQHGRQNAIGRTMAVHEGLDVDDDLLAHVDAAFQRSRSHVRQQHDLAGFGKLDQSRIYRRFVLEHVEAGA